MKKILFFLFIGGAMLAASCTKRYDVVEPNQTLYYDIKASDWGTSDGGLTDTAFIRTPQISNFINNHGSVLIDLTFDGGASFEPIPYVFDNVNYSYIYGVGGIIVYAQSANGATVIATPPAVTTKIILVDSN